MRDGTLNFSAGRQADNKNWRGGRKIEWLGGRPPSFISFTCANCQALYHVVKVEAGPETLRRGNMPRLRCSIRWSRRQVCPQILYAAPRSARSAADPNQCLRPAAFRHRGPSRKPPRVSSCVTPTGRRWPSSIARTSPEGGRQASCYRRRARRIAANIAKLPGLLKGPQSHQNE